MTSMHVSSMPTETDGIEIKKKESKIAPMRPSLNRFTFVSSAIHLCPISLPELSLLRVTLITDCIYECFSTMKKFSMTIEITHTSRRERLVGLPAQLNETFKPVSIMQYLVTYRICCKICPAIATAVCLIAFAKHRTR